MEDTPSPGPRQPGQPTRPAPRSASLDLPDTVEGVLRRIEHLCALVASFETCDEPFPPAREGAADVMLEAAALAAAVRVSLEPAALNVQIELDP